MEDLLGSITRRTTVTTIISRMIKFLVYVVLALCVFQSQAMATESPKVEEEMKYDVEKAKVVVESLAESDPHFREQLNRTRGPFEDSLLGIITHMISEVTGRADDLVGALSQLAQGLVSHNFELGKAYAYIPLLMTRDGPTHLMKMFVMMRDEGRISLEYRDAVDLLERYLTETEHKNIMERLVMPIARYPGAMVETFQSFTGSVLNSLFGLVG